MAPCDKSSTLRAEFLTADLLVDARTLTLLGGSSRYPRHGDRGHHQGGR